MAESRTVSDRAKAVIDGWAALQVLVRECDPHCPCLVCEVIRQSARLAQGLGDAER